MSQDLFAAFGEEDNASGWSGQAKPQEKSYAQYNGIINDWPADRTTSARQGKDAAAAVEDEDDFGDFEDASVANPSETSTGVIEIGPKPELKSMQSSSWSKNSSKKATKDAKDAHLPSPPAPKQQDLGHHPFAGHMDLLFETGDDEYDAGADELADLATNPEAAMAYSKRIIAEQEAAQVRLEGTFAPREVQAGSTAVASKSKPLEPRYAQKESTRSPIKDPNVLFDADDLSEENDEDEDEDDFDDFENGEESFEGGNQSVTETNSQQEGNTTAMDLLGLNETWQSANISYPDAEPSYRQPATSAGSLSQATSSMDSTQQIPSKEEADFWDDFETSAPAEAPSTSNTAISSLPGSESKDQSRKALSKGQDVLPPTNVPPPAVLLSIFPSVFAEADEALFNTIAKLDMKQKQMLLAHPASHQFLQRYLGHCTALARIIAGRKQRWKRDQRLSQSMRIGPAAAGGKGGMKLTGLDKSEVAKEDREVLDVLRLWKAQVGKLRTAVAAASAARGLTKLPSVPEITDQMAVKTLKSVEGGLTAPQPCALCGLKREERVAKVDAEVDDSFGEWWVQGMSMHLSCRNFWDESEKKLKSR